MHASSILYCQLEGILILIYFLKGVVYKLIPGLEKYRNTELAERKEKHKKQQAAEKEAEKNKEAKGSTSANATESMLKYFN